METTTTTDPPSVPGETTVGIDGGDEGHAPQGFDDPGDRSRDVGSGPDRGSGPLRTSSPPPSAVSPPHPGGGNERDEGVIRTIRVSNVSSSHWLAMDDCPMSPSLYQGSCGGHQGFASDACSGEEQPSGLKLCKGTAGGHDGEDLQGPHYWRKRPKPAPLLETAENRRELRRDGEQNNNPERSMKDRRLMRDDHGDEAKARSDKIRTSPSAKKELTVLRAKGQLSPNLVLSKTGRQGSKSHVESESAFTRQVVKPMKSSSVIQRNRAIFPSSYIATKNAATPFTLQFSGKKISSNHHLETFGSTGQVTVKMVEKVMKARLYLLQQTGPNSFLVGGDSPDHKYRIIIGPQKCSCGRETFCIHLLFVMLRVFQVPQNDPILSRRPLKNYEVEALFRNYHARRTLRLKDNQKMAGQVESKIFDCPKPKSEGCGGAEGDDVDDDEDDDDGESVAVNGPDDDGIEKEEEEEEVCPICLLSMVDGESLTECKTGCQNRLHHHCIAIWFEECRRQQEPLICPLCRAEWKTDEGGGTIVPASTPDLSLHPDVGAAFRPAVAAEACHPKEPLPPEHAEIAEKWIPVVGEDVVVRLFSKNWGVREAALRLLSQEAVGVLLLGVGEGRSGVLVSPERQANNHTMLECCCSILAFSLSDPVYKVFVSGLRALRMILSYTPSRDEQQQSRLQCLMKPVVKALLLKCADSNRKTSQLSISALEELVKGQEGELAVGREIVNPGNQGLGGIGYLIDCIVEIDAVENLHWQWILGRFCMIERLLEEYCHEFTVNLQSTSPESPSGDTISASDNFGRTFSILRFCTFHMNFGHIKVNRMARRMFYYIARLQLHNEALFERACMLLDDVETAIQRHMKRKLYSLLKDYSAVPHAKPEPSVFGERAPGDAVVSATSELTLMMLPHVSITASSPVTDVVTVMSDASPIVPGAASSTAGLAVLETDDVDSPIHPRDSPDFTPGGRGGEKSAVVGQRPRVEYADACVSTSPLPVHGADLWSMRNEAASASCSSNMDVSSESRCISERRNLVVSQVQELSANGSDAVGSTDGLPSKIVEPISTSFAFKKSMGSKESLCDSPPILSACLDSTFSGRRVGFLTEDLSDLLPSSGSEEKVSFKTEVASSPQNSPQRSANNTADDGCHCKEEVEKEEAEALAEALERSDLPQDVLPHVPGLSRLKSETALTIHLQDQNSPVTDEDGFDSRHQYQENVHWRRGPVLGTGAFSTCYQARDNKTGTLMAVKQISFCRNTISEQEKVVNAVKEEIHILGRLSHPNIIRILGATQQGYHFFMFVEWMPGCSVASLLDRYGQFSEPVITSYTLQMLRGLAYLHDNQVLHRDLKGANLLVDGTGQRVRIGDFGAAARLATRSTGAGEFEGQLLGTIAFMAPEVLRGDTYGRKCDIWSFGCTMVEMATAQPPWGANDVSNHLALIFKIASTVRPPPIPENLSPPIRDVMLRCLEVNPEDRPIAKDLLKHPLFRI